MFLAVRSSGGICDSMGPRSGATSHSDDGHHRAQCYANQQPYPRDTRAVYWGSYDPASDSMCPLGKPIEDAEPQCNQAQYRGLSCTLFFCWQKTTPYDRPALLRATLHSPNPTPRTAQFLEESRARPLTQTLPVDFQTLLATGYRVEGSDLRTSLRFYVYPDILHD